MIIEAVASCALQVASCKLPDLQQLRNWINNAASKGKAKSSTRVIASSVCDRDPDLQTELQTAGPETAKETETAIETETEMETETAKETETTAETKAKKGLTTQLKRVPKDSAKTDPSG